MELYEEIRVAAAIGQAFEQKEDITLFKLYGDDNFLLASKYTAKPWNGYNGSSLDQEAENNEEMVYITPSGEAYHKSAVCPYLKLSIHVANLENIGELRNLEGAKYERCPKCSNDKNSVIFITDYGNLYHSSLNCSHLKRTIEAVKKSEAGERHACHKCFGG